MAASPFTLEPSYLSYPRAWAHSLTGSGSTAASVRNYLTVPSANRLQVSSINSPTRPNESMPMGPRLQHYIMLRDLNVMDSKEFL